MPEWSFLTNHARVPVCIAAHPGVRLRDIPTTLAVTERTATPVCWRWRLNGWRGWRPARAQE
jgi:hypothetical protein